MAVNFGLLQPAQPVSAFFQGQQDVRQQAEQNMLRQAQMQQQQRQQLEFEQGQEERRRRMAQEGQFQKMADLVRQHGLDPDDPKVLGEFSQAALMSGQPQLASFATAMAERAAKRRAAVTEARQIGDILGPPKLPPGPPLQPGAQQNALARPTPMANALVAPQPDLFAGTPYSIGPVAAPMPGAAPAAAPSDNAAKIAQLENQRDALEALGTPAALTQAKRLDRQLEKLQPKALPADVAIMQQLGYPLTKEGYAQYRDAQRQERMLSPAEEQQRIRIAQASRPPREPKSPGAPVAVVDDATGRVKYVTAEEAIGKTPASAMEGLSPKEIQKREAAHPQATSSIKNFTAKSEQFIKELEKLRDDPGLDSITGTIYGVTPGVVSGEAGRRAMAAYNKIFAKGGFQALQDLKAASATGGALGNVSNEEGRRLEASTVGGIDRSQSLDDVKNGINDFIAEIRGSMKRVREAYDDTYEYRTSRGRAGAAPSAPAGLSPEDKQALDWANSNPKDPRAAQIKQRLGM
jgi:hypothetical protein